MRAIYLIIITVIFASGCIGSEGAEPNATAYCQQNGGFVVKGPSIEGPTDFCLFPDNSYCRASDFQAGNCTTGEKFYVCDAIGSRSEGYYDRDTKALIGFVRCSVSMPNPAAAYCQKQGGALEIRDDPRPFGGQYGVCVLPNGTECDEWAFYRGGCESCLTYCVKQPHVMCVGHWEISGEYPDCNCEYICG